MNRIIVPTDFSEGAWNALVYAVELAQASKTEQLLVINAYQEPHSGAATMLSIVELMKEESQEDLNKLQQKVEEKGYHQLVHIEYKSIHANLVGAVNSQLKEPGQLVVMGSLGETGALEKLIGSNTYAVMSKVDAPVLMIPLDAKFSFEGKLMLAVDVDHIPKSIDQAILKTMAEYHHTSTVEVVHVDHTEQTLGHEAFESLLPDVPFESISLSGDKVAQTINEYMASQPVDILVLLRIKRSYIDKLLHTSLTKKLALQANIPILVIKEDPASGS